MGASFQTSLVAKVLAGLYAAGATLSALTIVLPHPSSQNAVGLLAIVVDAYAVAVVLYWRAHKLRAWTLPATLAWGSTLITGVAYFSGESPSPLVFFYLWVFLYASYFLTRRRAAIQIAYVGAAYGALLASRPPTSGIPAWWLVAMGTLIVAAILIMSVRVRVESLISRLYDAARTDPLTQLFNRRGFPQRRVRRGLRPDHHQFWPCYLSARRRDRCLAAASRRRGSICRQGQRLQSDHAPQPPAARPAAQDRWRAGHRGRALPRGHARPRRGGRPALQRQRQTLRDRRALRGDDGPRARPTRATHRPCAARRDAARHRQDRRARQHPAQAWKPTEEELAVIKRHPELGAQMLEHSSLTDVRAWVGAHHERPDGLGYPLGISGDALALEARIVAVADAYEAMTSDRSYRDSIGHAGARAELMRCAGSQFDRRVVDAFLVTLQRESKRADAALARANY